jgi:outer membrane protein assembly factor BamB
MKYVVIGLMAFLAFPNCFAQNDFAQWRGPNRDGIYPGQNLLTQWPAGGPQMLWKYDDLGIGYSSAVATSNRVYTSGTIDSISYLFSFDPKGTLLWKKPLGPDWTGEWPGIYSTPVINGDLGYIANSLGVVYCFNSGNGDVVWKRDLMKEFMGYQVGRAFLDNLIVDGEVIYCAPGGAGKNIVALNRKTGNAIWESKGDGKVSVYCSPILIETGGKKLYVYQADKTLIAINTANGEIVWTDKKLRSIASNTPIFRNGYLFTLADEGSEMLKISDDGLSFTKVWQNPDFYCFQGDAVVINDRIYGKGKGKVVACADWKTGRILYTTPAAAMVINIIAAEGLLYCYDFNGNVSLLKPLDNKFENCGSFSIPGGRVEHCSHHIINDGRLYIRHDNSLFVYNIAK